MERAEMEKVLRGLFTDPAATENPELLPMMMSMVNVYMQKISEEIGHAIGPVRRETAPFFIGILEQYAQVLRAQFPGDEKMIDLIKRCHAATITMPAPEE